MEERFMKSIVKLVVLVLALSMLFASVAIASIGAVQVQLQGVTQTQSSSGGLSFSSQAYGGQQSQVYQIEKIPTFFSPSAGAATGGTSLNTGGAQFKFGSGTQNSNFIGGSLNGGGLLW